jgi:hypothetical protein
MAINLLPREPAAPDDAETQDDPLARVTPAALTDADPAADDRAIEEREWYPPPDAPCM